MKCFFSHKIRLCFLLFLTVNVAVSQNLSLSLKIGKTYYQTTKGSATMLQTIDGIESLTKINLDGQMSFEVINEDQDSFHLIVKFISLAMQMDSPYANMVVDSNNENATDVFTKVLRGMLDSEFEVKMYRNGFIKEIHMDSLFNNLLDSFPEIPRFQKRSIIDRLKQVYGEKAFKGNLEMITAIFPKKKVTLNEKWHNEIKLESGMSAEMKNEFTLKKYNKRLAHIELKSKTIAKDSVPFVDLGDNLTRYDLEGTMEANIIVDSKTGWIISSEITQDFGGIIEIKDRESEKILFKTPTSFKNNMVITGE